MPLVPLGSPVQGDPPQAGARARALAVTAAQLPVPAGPGPATRLLRYGLPASRLPADQRRTTVLRHTGCTANHKPPPRSSPRPPTSIGIGATSRRSHGAVRSLAFPISGANFQSR
jgi:hypothetical protein